MSIYETYLQIYHCIMCHNVKGWYDHLQNVCEICSVND